MIHLIKQNGRFTIYFPSNDHKAVTTRQRHHGPKKYRRELETVECGKSLSVSKHTAKALFDAAREANAIASFSYIEGDVDVFIRQELFN